jgi:hypothetical protein
VRFLLTDEEGDAADCIRIGGVVAFDRDLPEKKR